ncbi:TPA: hypothetical protein DDY55_03615 [Candidatus Falkowbacteria bacterium]|nr:hypothetical protein [Candidatus Falkowbacteria bacterium]HAY12378.1 hypothetical protein [Candidatus Falkowbacteria bacterium]HBI97183.1 hypothetical protein [Candidatus Falkowbacteria bacterium]HBT27567.1 hypothetical protein [Candidatus Falkowbacteria bacterium]HBY15051.1 hypothetical protein [Candidatus Falkowbacteria bacterium]
MFFLNGEKVGTFLNDKALSISDGLPKWYKIKGKMEKKIDIGKNDECKYYPVCTEVACKILKYCHCQEYPDLKIEILDYSCVDCPNLSSYGKNKKWCDDQEDIEALVAEGAKISATIETISVKKSDIGLGKTDKKKKPIMYSIYDGHDLIIDDDMKEVLCMINGPNSFTGEKIVLRQYFEDGNKEIVLTKRLPKYQNIQAVMNELVDAVSPKPIEKSRYKIILNKDEFNITRDKLSDALDLVDEIRDYSLNFIVKLFELCENGEYSEIDVA